MPSSRITDPKHWFDRAAQMRILAGEIRDINAKEMMLRLAHEYDEIGDRLALRADSGQINMFPGAPVKPNQIPPKQH